MKIETKLDETLRVLQQVGAEVAAIVDSLDAAGVPTQDEAGRELTLAGRVRLMAARLTPPSKPGGRGRDSGGDVSARSRGAP